MMRTTRGRERPFRVGGLGIGGIGVSTIEAEAEGEVYDLDDLSKFPGAHAQARYGFAFGMASGGDLWLGLMLSLGDDAVSIAMDD